MENLQFCCFVVRFQFPKFLRWQGASKAGTDAEFTARQQSPWYWLGYNGLIDPCYGHYRGDHSRDEFARGRVHINGIENFRGVTEYSW